jgi:SAM-dependent methyltransferase
MDNTFEYTGTQNLQNLEYAVNYNVFLKNLILRFAEHVPHRNASEKSGFRILDIGAGIGTFAEMLKKENYEVSCVELDKKQSVIIEEKGLEVFSSIDEIPDNSVDFIYSLNVLEHIENDVQEFAKWVKKLKTGGKIFIYVPAFNCIWSALDTKVAHYRRYTKETLKQVFVSSGIKIQKSQYADCLGFFAALIYKFLNKNGDLTKNSLIFYDRIAFPLSRIFDLIFSGYLGKNFFTVGKKKDAQSARNYVFFTQK